MLQTRIRVRARAATRPGPHRQFLGRPFADKARRHASPCRVLCIVLTLRRPAQAHARSQPDSHGAGKRNRSRGSLYKTGSRSSERRTSRRTYAPFILTLFFFILFANLLGLVPYGSTATGNISVTATLAILTSSWSSSRGMRTLGKNYIKTIVYWPHDQPMTMKAMLTPLLTPLESPANSRSRSPSRFDFSRT